jgi:hypothetical protein
VRVAGEAAAAGRRQRRPLPPPRPPVPNTQFPSQCSESCSSNCRLAKIQLCWTTSGFCNRIRSSHAPMHACIGALVNRIKNSAATLTTMLQCPARCGFCTTWCTAAAAAQSTREHAPPPPADTSIRHAYCAHWCRRPVRSPKGARCGHQQAEQHQGVRQQVVRPLRDSHIARVERRGRRPRRDRDRRIRLPGTQGSVAWQLQKQRWRRIIAVPVVASRELTGW